MQNEQIEQEFFEVFGIEKKDHCEMVCKGDLCSTNCDYYKNKKSEYPPITPEIVLGLEEIIFRHNFKPLEDFKIERTKYTHWFLNEKLRQGEPKYYTFYNLQERINALLELCIQLKDEIQDQVKDLFNA